MKTKLILFFALVFLGATSVFADEQERKVEPFSEVSLRIAAKVHLEQGEKQHVEIVAKASMLDEIITEVKDRKLIIRFPTKNLLKQDFIPGKIEIFITIPEVTALSISGSGDIIAEGDISARILDLATSGSGGISLPHLSSERIKAAISGSSDITLGGSKTVTDLSVMISGSGNVKALDLPVEDVNVKISGSGNASVQAQKTLVAKLAGSGNVRYKGDPQIEKSVAGSGTVSQVD